MTPIGALRRAAAASPRQPSHFYSTPVSPCERMSDVPASPNVVGIRDVYDIVSRLETKVDSRLSELDSKVDAVTSRMDRLEGGLSMLRWLGPLGVVALFYGIGKAAGFF
jgi:hypothetical protein